MTPITLYECTLPKLSFQLNSWKKTNVCFCIPTTRRKSHASPPDVPLFPFPPGPEQRPCKWPSGLRAELDFSEISSAAVDMVFGIRPGTFHDCIIPETVQSLWGPVPLERLPPGVDNSCRAVTHDIVSGTEDKRLSVYLIHSVPLLLSAVQDRA